MARLDRAVFDAGPLIHFAQVGSPVAFALFRKILVPDAVWSEVANFELPGKRELEKAKNVGVVRLSSSGKDFARLVSEKFGLEAGEAQALALARQEKVRFFFTDDLTAREAAKELGFEVHGSVGILTRAYREGLLSRKEAVRLVLALQDKSSLFVTSAIVKEVIREIEAFRR